MTVVLRPDIQMTLTDLAQSKTVPGLRIADVALHAIKINEDSSDPTLVLGEEAEIPLTKENLLPVADRLQIPTPFFQRIGADAEHGLNRQAALVKMVQQAAGDEKVRVEFTDQNVLAVTPPKDRLRPVHVVQTAIKVLGENAVVQRVKDDSGFFGFDVHVPFNSAHGVGGDPESYVDVPSDLLNYSWVTGIPVQEGHRVGDVTSGGLRFGMDVKHGLAPEIHPYLFRLACTNGMETQATLPVIDLRRAQTVDEVLVAMEEAAQIAFGKVEEQIEHFYRLRERRLENPERFLTAAAQERGLSASALGALLTLAPTVETEFDAVNLITNLANRQRRDGSRLLLERAGGGIVADETERCSQCQHKLI